MALNDFLLSGRWRAELVLDTPGGRRSFGWWDRDEATFGAEAATVHDPELGRGIPVGGVPTADELTISRPWKASRDRPAWQELKAWRGRVGGELLIWELDEWDQPYSSSPLDRLQVVVTQVVLPGGESGSNDPSRIAVQLQVRA